MHYKDVYKLNTMKYLISNYSKKIKQFGKEYIIPPKLWSIASEFYYTKINKKDKIRSQYPLQLEWSKL